jgi:hypothetical protein
MNAGLSLARWCLINWKDHVRVEKLLANHWLKKTALQGWRAKAVTFQGWKQWALGKRLRRSKVEFAKSLCAGRSKKDAIEHWRQWARTSRKFRVAAAHFRHAKESKALNCWRLFVREVRMSRIMARVSRRHTYHTLMTWRANASFQRKLRAFNCFVAGGNEAKFKKQAFTMWKKWASILTHAGMILLKSETGELRMRCDRWKKFTRQRLAVRAIGFNLFKSASEKNARCVLRQWRNAQIASKYWRRRVLLDYFCKMRRHRDTQTGDRAKLEKAMAKWGSGLTFKVFFAWREHTSLVQSERKALIEERREWLALQHHLVVHKTQVMKSTLSLWKTWAQKKVKTRRVINRFRFGKGACKALTTWLHFTQTRLEAARRLDVASAHCRAARLRAGIGALRIHIIHHHKQRQNMAKSTAMWSSNLTGKCFYRWLIFASRTAKLKQFLARVAEGRKQFYFRQWAMGVKVQKADLFRKNTWIIVRSSAFVLWKEWARARATQRTTVECHIDNRKSARCQRAIGCWVVFARRRVVMRKAIEWSKDVLCDRVFYALKNHVKDMQERRGKLVAIALGRSDDCLVKKVFAQWKGTLGSASRRCAKVEEARNKNDQHLARRVLGAWRDRASTRVSSIERSRRASAHYTNRLRHVCFFRWRTYALTSNMGKTPERERSRVRCQVARGTKSHISAYLGSEQVLPAADSWNSMVEMVGNLEGLRRALSVPSRVLDFTDE